MRFFRKRLVRYMGHVCTPGKQSFFQHFITGICIEATLLGLIFFVALTVGQFPYAMLIAVMIGFMALIPILGGIIACWTGFFLILMVSPVKAVMFLILFVVIQQVGGKSDLSSYSWRLSRTSGNLGAGGSYPRRKSYGSCGNADLYPTGVCFVCIVP